MKLDAIRARYPKLGIALYAIDPDGPVTLETYASDGQYFSFTGASFAEVIGLAFPELEEPEPAEPTEAPAEELAPEESVFD